MFCPTCGRELEKGMRFCPTCGRALREQIDYAGDNEEQIEDDINTEKNKMIHFNPDGFDKHYNMHMPGESRSQLPIIVAIFLLLIIVVLLIILLVLR